MTLPAPLAVDYRVARSQDVRSWSFGAVKAPRRASATFQDNVRDTLHDQRIFGPVHDFRCACGKYSGDRYQGMICDRCGVKVAPSAIRGARCGHIELAEDIAHPFDAGARLECFPVLPTLFVQSPGGSALAALYDQLVVAANEEDAAQIDGIIASIFEHLTPVVVTAHNWRLAAARILARGLALEHKDAGGEPPGYCPQCGYLLAGLKVVLCPGCGSQLP